MLQCVAVCRNVLHMCCIVYLIHGEGKGKNGEKKKKSPRHHGPSIGAIYPHLHCVAVCCSVLQYVAVCCNVYFIHGGKKGLSLKKGKICK